MLFRLGDVVWLPYSQDIFQMIQFEDYCDKTPGLYFLKYSYSDSARGRAVVNKQPITSLHPGEIIYVDIRKWAG